MTTDALIKSVALEMITVQGSNTSGWTATHSHFPFTPAHGKTVNIALRRLKKIVEERRKTHWSDFMKLGTV